MTHELDRIKWLGFHEPDYVPFGDPTDPGTGDFIAGYVEKWLKRNNTSLPPDAKYLGLAAGQAYPELRAINRLGISAANVTLVDKGFSRTARARFEREFPEVQAIDSGMFEFLENPPSIDFSLVTALGIEYALKDPVAMQTLISLLPRTMRQGGIVAVFPYTGDEDPSLNWEANGFQPLFPYSTFDGYAHASTLIYRLGENSQAAVKA